MSRVGKNPIIIPIGVTVNYINNFVEVEGKLGKDSYRVPHQINFEKKDNIISIIPKLKDKTSLALWGTVQRRIANMVQGVDKGVSVKLESIGVGYKASVQGSKLILQLGFSHDIEFLIPPSISIKCDKPTTILITGFSKQEVGQIAAEIRSYRPPEPYKGKGVRRVGLQDGEAGEYIIRKEGKKK
jgi:large subunit ribosomal protein L6